MFHDLGNMVGTYEDIRPSDHQKSASRRAFNQAASSFENRDACAFGADERPRDMKATFWKEVVQVVSGDATRDIRKLTPDLFAISAGELL